MFRKVKKRIIYAAVCLASLGFPTQAQDIFFNSLGRMPFPDTIEIRQSRSVFQPSHFLRNAGIMSVPEALPAELFGALAFPEGMCISFGSQNSVETTHVYQMSQDDLEGIYLVAAASVSGKSTGLFTGEGEKSGAFWSAPADRVFTSEDQKFFDALPKTPEQMSLFLNRRLKKERIEGEVKAVLYKPWARYHSAEGITRWQSDIWLLLRWEGQIFPLWIRSTVFTGTDGALSVLTFWGTPAAGRRFSDSILYSLYEMKGDQ
ncbi:MAG TPA: hypothetical protein DCS74_03490 [Veillonellaceae bacterium]|jgi:hypothetical protein|nr:hypothetical protein [Veillonellaceae bacterium]